MTPARPPSRAVVGCDPGYGGGIAVLRVGAPTLYRMPLLRQKKHAYDVAGMSAVLEENVLGVPLLVVELVTRPASLTYCMGVLVGIGWALGYEVVRVRPQTWKAYFGLGPAKADSIALALKRWPSLRRTITKRGDDGLAEAALIALWGRENL